MYLFTITGTTSNGSRVTTTLNVVSETAESAISLVKPIRMREVHTVERSVHIAKVEGI